MSKPINGSATRTKRWSISRRGRLILILTATLVVFYIVSYAVMSAMGRYEPIAVGLNGVKGYGWAPYGFVKKFRWRHPLMYAYLPLFRLDHEFWHRPGLPDPQKYPVNEVAPQRHRQGLPSVAKGRH